MDNSIFKKNNIKLGINIDHIATLRNIRNNIYPNPLYAALILEKINLDFITFHLREDRRHINENDIKNIKLLLNKKINLEISPNKKMINLCNKLKPNSICLVPEKRNELTTENGINLIKNFNKIKFFIKKIKNKKIKISLFIDPEIKQIEKAIDLGIKIIELNSRYYTSIFKNYKKCKEYLLFIKNIFFKYSNYLKINIGHGLNLYNIKKIISISNINEINIGHFIISRSIFVGIKQSISEIIYLINNFY